MKVKKLKALLANLDDEGDVYFTITGWNAQTYAEALLVDSTDVDILEEKRIEITEIGHGLDETLWLHLGPQDERTASRLSEEFSKIYKRI